MFHHCLMACFVPTMRANKPSLAFVSLDLLFQIRYLVESKFTPQYRTNEGFFSCVNTKMVKQIMPFSKDFCAIRKITRESISDTIGLVINIFNMTESFGVWQVRFTFIDGKVKGFSGYTF